MTKAIYIFLALAIFCIKAFGQHSGITFQEAEKRGIRIEHLDSIYTSAIHSDTSMAVFKTQVQQDSLLAAYTKLLQDLGNFLSDNNFKWDKPTRCFNRIYFNPDGAIDYFLYNFLGSPKEKLKEENSKNLNVY